MIFVDTGFFFALSATDEKERHHQARELLETLQGRTLSDVLITTDHIVFETLILIQTTLTRNAHARAVRVGEQLYSEKLARIHRTTFQEQLEAFAYLRQHKTSRQARRLRRCPYRGGLLRHCSLMRRTRFCS